MEKFVVRRQRKGSCDNDARSPQKKVKLESDERVMEEVEEDDHTTPAEFSHPIPWQKIEAEGLDCDYALLFSKEEADQLFRKLEQEVVYTTGAPSKCSCEVMGRGCAVAEGLWLFLSQGKTQKSSCLEKCTISRESRPHMETRV